MDAIFAAAVVMWAAALTPGAEPPADAGAIAWPMAGEDPLPGVFTVGDVAPEMKIPVYGWSKGEWKASLPKGRIWVVETFSSAYPECVARMPVLSEWARRDPARLGVIAVSIAEREWDELDGWVEVRRDQIDFEVARDESGEWIRAWMDASLMDVVPTTFIVDAEGRLAWLGPSSFAEEPLANILSGTYDFAGAVALSLTNAREAVRVRDLRKQAEPLEKELREAWAAGDRAKALSAADKIIALDPILFSKVASLKFYVMLVEERKPAEAYGFARARTATAGVEDSEFINAVAYLIATEDIPDADRDLDYALELARRVDGWAKGESPAFQETLGRVQFLRGFVEEAIGHMERAIALQEDPNEQQRLAADLEPMRAMLEKMKQDGAVEGAAEPKSGG